MIEENYLPAGEFSSWFHHIQCALAEETGTDLPCGECTACCTSSYFINIRPEEILTLLRIPKGLLFAAPGLPKGNVLLGYDEHGRCPMFIDGKCSIYENRPLTCRAYDCRLFAAVGIDAGDDDKALINQRVRLWKFSYPSQLDLDMHSAVRSAARFLLDHAESFPAGIIPNNPTQLAIFALKIHTVFLTCAEEKEKTGREKTEMEIVNAVMEVVGNVR